MASSSDTTHFLLVYNLDEQRLHEQKEFEDADEAVRAYHDMERTYLNARDEFEVVLIGSDSINTVMQTHASYFQGTASRVKDLVGPIEEILNSLERQTAALTKSQQKTAEELEDLSLRADELERAATRVQKRIGGSGDGKSH